MVNDPMIKRTFRPSGSGYVSCNGGACVSCPPYVIARLALKCEGYVDLPDGYTPATLETIKALTGWLDRETGISHRQADELADIGGQLLALWDHGALHLEWWEQDSITHLMNTITKEKARDRADLRA